MSIICLGLNHKTAPVNIRERFSLIEAQLSAAMQALSDQPGIDESLILSTCNRTEVYISSENAQTAKESLYGYLFLIHKITPKQIEKYFYFLADNNAVKHLFTVASGLDSMILGEGQILSQIKQAYKFAKHYKSVKDTLDKLFVYAIETGKRARSETKICCGASSVSFAAIELLKKTFDNLSSLKILVIGTGKMGHQAVDFLQKSGVKTIFLTNRSFEKSLKIAGKINAVAVKFENIYDVMKEVNIIISSTSSPHFIITKNQLKKVSGSTNHKPLFIIDIAIPRDVDPDVKKIKNITLYNIDDLGKIVNQTLDMREAEIEKVNLIIEEELAEFIQLANTKKIIPVIQNIQQKYESVLIEMLDMMPEEEKEKFKRFGNKFIGKLLHRPIVEIKKLSNNEKFLRHLDFIKQIFY